MRNALSLYGIQAAQYILPWLTFPYLVRILPTDKWGAIAFAQAFVQYFVTVTEYGFNFSATREVSIHRDDRPRLSRIFTSVMIAKAMLMLGCLGVMSAIVFATPKFRADWPLYFITFLTVIGNVLFPQWLFQGLEEMQYITVREVGARLIGLLPTFLLVRHESDYLIAAAIQSGSSALAGAVGLVGLQRFTGVWFSPVKWADIRATFVEGWHIFLSTAAINLYTRSNTFVLGLVATETQVGYYSTPLRLIDAGKSLVFPLTTAIYPHISRLSHSDPQAAVNFIRNKGVRIALPFAAMSLALFAGAPLFVRLLFGHKYLASIPLLRIMAPIPFVVALGATYATYFMLGMGYKKEWSRMIMQAGLFNFAVLIPALLVMPAATAVAVTGTLAETFVLVRSYTFYREKQR